MVACEAERKKFQDYHIHHCKRLRELWINLENVVNELCEIVEWFDKEVQALPGVITKKNKNFLCYCLAGVLRMMYENASCGHLEGLEAIMNSCDASLLDDIPDEIAKLSGRIVRGWWALALCHGCFSCCAGGKDVCCNAWRLLILTSVCCALM
jgi:hypothetical protein